MDNQTENLSQPIPQQNTSSNISWLKTISIGFSIVSFCIAIGIGGYFLAANKNQSISQNQTMSPTVVQPTPTIDPTANWKTYTNTKYKFTLFYPADWEAQVPEISSNSFRLDFLKFDNDYNDFERPNITLIINEENSNGIVNNLNTEYNSKKEYKTIGSLTGNFYQGITESTDFSGKNTFKRYHADFLVNKNNVNYWFRLATKPELRDNHNKVFNQILSTFKFTDQNQTPTPTCMQRPACLDATPRCLIAEPAEGWCPK